MDVRKAETTDIETAVELMERSRRQFQKFQPTFWRKAEKSAAATETFFGRLLTDPDTYFLVAVEGSRLEGFLIARKFPSSPVFDPGGDTWLIDDFCVAEPRLWLSIGEALLSHATTLIHEHGGVQVVVVSADRDLAKTEMLRRSDLTIASNWWTKPLR
ncbi:GNAT family N-acetyltransferase [Reyranella soli]|uniref:N-acetyltransferase n=1 Tax=Reyranella soli TaxID=1230389 RepID=A0A512N3F0_9HYPH|nr:GNAT family N-acetyltransferase [Reyranella soli]GEP53473.1 N-acetyltransferase [Reyranella soli]